LQNRDGGMPTFCRGWGALPFDRSTPEITAHTLWAFASWRGSVREPVAGRIDAAHASALSYLQRSQLPDGSWHPLWFGNEHTADEENPVHGTAMVLLGLAHAAPQDEPSAEMMQRAAGFLLTCQHADGGWGGAAGIVPSVEETANAVNALGAWIALPGAPSRSMTEARAAMARGARWLLGHTRGGLQFPAAPIGLYFARLWYHEKLYPVIWTLGALRQAAVTPGENPSESASVRDRE
jgi:squalene-hopene/tetraprenyl-beta-curcumene cyclase